MKKIVFIALFGLCISTGVFAQVFVGGAISAVRSVNDTRGTLNVSVAPEIGYMLNEQWMFGAKLDYRHISIPNTQNSNTFSATAFGRRELLGKVKWGLWADFGIGMSRSLSDAAYYAYIKPLLTYRAGQHFLLKTELDFAAAKLGYAVRETGDGTLSYALGLNADELANLSDLSIGVLFLF